MAVQDPQQVVRPHFWQRHPGWTAVIAIVVLLLCGCCGLSTTAFLTNKAGLWAMPTLSEAQRESSGLYPLLGGGSVSQTQSYTLTKAITELVPGDLAWVANTRLENNEIVAYGLEPIGSLEVSLPYVVETWGPGGGVVFVGKANSVTWISGHYGGTGWYIDPNADLAQVAAEHAANIQARDGVVPEIAVLPGNGFSLLQCYQTKPVPPNGQRICDSVGATIKANVKAAGTAQGAQGVQASGGTTATDGELPAQVNGPAIVEWNAPGTGKCGVFYLDSGSVNLTGVKGHWWTATSVRFPAHKATFLSKYPSCVEGRP
jgi:hypothetical protein